MVRLGELSLDTSQAVKRDGLPIQFLFEKTRLLFRGSFANNPFHHLRRQPIGKTVLTVLNTLPDHFLIGGLFFSCSISEHYPMIAVIVLSGLRIGLLNCCTCCFVSEHLFDFANSGPVKINLVEVRKAEALAPKHEICVVNRFVYPVFYQHGQLIRGNP